MEFGKKKNQVAASTALRLNAEEYLKATSSEVPNYCNEGDYQRLINELEVYKIELEMQNADLRHARLELETTLEKYTDLYEFAPVGYFTLDSSRNIEALNLAGASIIGGVRSRLIGRHFEQYVVPAQRQFFAEFLDKVIGCQIKESCEVVLLNWNNKQVIVQIEAMATASGQELRLVVIDITEQRRAEDVLAVNKQGES